MANPTASKLDADPAPVGDGDASSSADSTPPESAEETAKHLWVAVRDFKARHLTQLLVFTKGDELEHDLGEALAAKGAPVRPVE